MATTAPTTASLDARITALEATPGVVNALVAGVDQGWTMYAGTLVFMMHPGFALLESGSARVKNTQSVLLKNLVAVCAGAIGWWAFGYAFAFGEDNENAEAVTKDGMTGYDGFIGTTGFFTQDKHLGNKGVDSDGAGRMGLHFAHWFFQFTFCATAATIVSGAIAERARLDGFAIFSLWMTTFVYPVVVHWTWGYGWLYMDGYTDFAGSGIVHLVGGWTALLAAKIIGPRIGRFDPDVDQTKFAPSNILHVTLGTFLLWFGWFGFNGGSTVALSGNAYITAGRCMVNTTIAGAFGGMTVWIVCFLQDKMQSANGSGKHSLGQFANGILAGLVGITAGCNAVDTWAAFLIGVLSGFFYLVSYKIVDMLKVDDPVSAYCVHGGCGIWGVIATGLFHMKTGLIGDDSDNKFEHDDGKGCMGPNLLGIVVIICWVTALTTPVLVGLKLAGVLRVNPEVEIRGLDSKFENYNEGMARKGSLEEQAEKEDAKKEDANDADPVAVVPPSTEV